MEQNFQTSFIPKKPMIKERAVSSQSVSVFLIISLFVLVATILATGGLYFYQKVLVTKVADKENSLKLSQNGFEPSKITELQVLDKRLRASTEILSNHVDITPVFDALQKLTMKSVRFTKFSYDFGTSPNANTKIGIKLSGQANSYLSIALQSDLFATDKNLIDPVFSNLTLDNNGNVIFNLDFSVDPSFVNYQKTLLTKSQS